MIKSRSFILAKIESVYGTDPVPVVGTDAIMVEDLAFSFAGARMNERPATRPSLGKLQQVYGGALGQVSFSAELKGPGSAYSASNKPEIDPLLRACAMAVTLVTTPGSETATYKPVSTGHESCTIYFYLDGTRHILTGCRGTVEFSMETGARGMAKFTLTGHVAARTDTALGAPTFDSVAPPTMKGGSLLIGAYAAVVNAVNFNLGNTVAMPPSLNAADGFADIRITGRDVTGSFDPEDIIVATYPFEANWKAGTAAVLDTGVIGGTQYNRFKATFPVCYYREIAHGDRDGIATYDLTFGAAESAGDDEVSLIYS